MAFKTLCRVTLAVCTALALNVSAVSADEDSGRKLELEGAVAAGVPSRVSVADIETIGLVTETVYDPFDKVEATYSGVWLNDFVAAYGAEVAESLTTTAIDGYAVTWTPKDWDNYRVLLATQVNGQHLKVENKGPMRVIFADFDANDSDFKETLPKWVWMITNIRFD